MIEASADGVDVHPQLVGRLFKGVRPGKRFPKLADVNQSAGYRLVDSCFFARGEHGMGWDRAAADVLDLVRDRAAPLGLQQAVIERDGAVPEVGESDDLDRQLSPMKGPVGQRTELSPRVMHALQHARRLRQSQRGHFWPPRVFRSRAAFV